ncbi:hypothetical protein EA472_16470 [Natrarchaeobius oligotrophus]|uniref:Uncharacterized protein n=2 Tax=Natrarchaeobius TaxID=2501796 RepID=A0A3N6MMY5_NATCH|nr:hypothetical protein EA472_16470 [Natrarchaeobius chitinivorans]
MSARSVADFGGIRDGEQYLVSETECPPMSSDGSLMATEDEEFVREIMYIMIVWTIAVIIAGIVLVLLRDPFAGLFAFAPIGL